MPKKKKPPLSVLVYTEENKTGPDFLIAHCLEWDLVSQSQKSERDLLEGLAELMVRQREYLDEDNQVPGTQVAPRPASNEYYEMYEEGVPGVSSVEFPEPVQIKKVVDDD